MTFWRNIANMAARRVDAADCLECPAGLPGEDPAFSTAVTALGAKLAMVDGRAAESEYAAFSEVFQADARSEQDIRRLYDLARQTTHGFESYARRLAHRYQGCPQLLEDVIDGLFHIAKSDGVVTGSVERDHLWAMQTPQIFHAEILERAYRQILRLNETVTDEVSAVDRLGIAVVLTRMDEPNFKITHPRDLDLARLVLESRKS